MKRNYLDVQLQGVRFTALIESEEIVRKNRFKTSWISEKLEKKNECYEHVPDSVSKNSEVKLRWDMNIECDHVINKKEKKCAIVNIAVPGDTESVKGRMRR